MKFRIVVSLCLLFSLAFARVEFGTPTDKDTGLNVISSAADFRDFEKIATSCAASGGSFWCNNLDDQLTLITTKSTDYIFSSRGELVAVYAKQQKGQDLRGNYSLDARNNLVPAVAGIPSLAVLLDKDYLEASEVEGRWRQLSATEMLGEFRFTLDNQVQVEKEVIVSGVSNTISIVIRVSRLEDEAALAPSTDGTTEAAEISTTTAPEAIEVQLATSGIGKASSPVIKIGQGLTATDAQVRVENPSYISIQTSNSRGNAFIFRPDLNPEDSLFASYDAPSLDAPRFIYLAATLAEDASTVQIKTEMYAGLNELVRFYQEGYYELPSLFSPNIFGRLSLAILFMLEWIHRYVPNWGLTIIALTLVFRAIIWPLMNSQTKSMVAMQKLQPEMQKLQKKFKDDREKLTQATMKLYQEHGVNPLGGCLPMFVQMPLLFMLWRVFVNYEFNEGFLWIPDLGLPDPLYILPIMYLGVMFGQAYLTAKDNPKALQQALLMNAVFAFIIFGFPAGVTLYWVVGMLVHIGQHYLIQRTMEMPKKVKTA